ncbi:MAG: MBOAT family protein, partial [Planctomycetes bacterium]|nr:MBOAT family protein [Planctomycetota bacterium]
FLVGERLAAGKVRAPRLLQHLYVLVAVMVGWVLFRAESFAHATYFLRAMAGLHGGGAPWQLYLSNKVALMLVLGALGSTPWLPWASAQLSRLYAARRSTALVADVGAQLALLLLFFACAIELAAGTHNPFIYYRF